MTSDAAANNANEMFFSTSSDDVVQVLHVSFANQDPSASLGVQLINMDVPERELEAMFTPGYAIVGRLLPPVNEESISVAQQFHVHPSDIIVAINGHGFRRFAIENSDSMVVLNTEDQKVEVDLDHAVVNGTDGSAYQQLMAKLKAVKAANGDPPLIITFERYGWDTKTNAWIRFLTARDHNVPAAMKMMQDHELWKESTFPISLTSPGLQRIFQERAVSEIHTEDETIDHPPTVYVNYGLLQQLQSAGHITTPDIVSAFVIFTERMLSKSVDPRKPQTCQFIDLSGVSMISSSGFRVDALKQIYNTFEPNYPETLHKMVIYPVSTIMVRILLWELRRLLSLAVFHCHSHCPLFLFLNFFS
jgi:CRAL/TRIO domain